MREELRISQEGQITDRYTKAVENLGNESMDVRLGGIYALQRIMEDSSRDHPTISNVLASYIRTHASRPPGKGQEVPADVQAALRVLITRDARHDDYFVPDLRAAQLPGVKMAERAALIHDDELSTRLRYADLREVDLSSTLLPFADLYGATLEKATLHKADLAGADLTYADLTGADVTKADLHSANLTHADLTGADLAGADLSGADLSGADLANADLNGTSLKTLHLTKKQALAARITNSTKLPAGMAEDPAIRARIAEVKTAGAEHG
ncbi:pentapeptide repeat-containing protein [Streptomyces scopuliridis]|uniref:pentapeptide repeat-containing protein n=1 Tax=Streptomyces scopuliridis TaxID=452529 RepID=UPI003691737A